MTRRPPRPTWRLLPPVLAAVLPCLAPEAAAQAPAPRVTILRAPDGDPVVTEAVTRIQGELVAAGFAIVILDQPPTADARARVEALTGELDSLAVLFIVAGADRRAVDVWLADRLTGKTLVRHVELAAEAGPRASAALAVRIVELLRASLLELMVTVPRAAGSPPASPPPQVTLWVADGLADASGPLGFEAGAALLHSFAGIGPVMAPLVRVTYRLRPALAMRLTAVGLGTRPRLSSAAGTAELDQHIALVEAAALFRPHSRLRPLLSLGAGAFHMGVDGTGTSPWVGRSDGFWGGAATLGAGVLLRLGWHGGIAAEAHGLLLMPYPIVRIAEVEAGRAGRPSVLATITLIGWL